MQKFVRTDAAGQKFQNLTVNVHFCDVANISGGRGGGEIASDYNESLNKVDVSFKIIREREGICQNNFGIFRDR
jgi:hypothetical protein